MLQCFVSAELAPLPSMGIHDPLISSPGSECSVYYSGLTGRLISHLHRIHSPGNPLIVMLHPGFPDGTPNAISMLRSGELHQLISFSPPSFLSIVYWDTRSEAYLVLLLGACLYLSSPLFLPLLLPRHNTLFTQCAVCRYTCYSLHSHR